jgi:hypothetical protein
VSQGLIDNVLTCRAREELDHQSEVNIEWEPSPPQRRKM